MIDTAASISAAERGSKGWGRVVEDDGGVGWEEEVEEVGVGWAEEGSEEGGSGKSLNGMFFFFFLFPVFFFKKKKGEERGRVSIDERAGGTRMVRLGKLGWVAARDVIQ
jgi:hypothetical protein